MASVRDRLPQPGTSKADKDGTSIRSKSLGYFRAIRLLRGKILGRPVALQSDLATAAAMYLLKWHNKLEDNKLKFYNYQFDSKALVFFSAKVSLYFDGLPDFLSLLLVVIFSLPTIS